MDKVIEKCVEQDKAIEKFEKWAAGDSKEFRLGGSAGTGKTTLIRQMRELMGNCQVITPTAKAAEVLQKKGVPAKTICSMFRKYRHDRVDKNGKLQPVFDHKMNFVDFIIVDESSMANRSDYETITMFSDRVVWVGDHYQLPAVEEDGDPPTNVLTPENLDFELTKNHRTDQQHLIDTATFIRNGGNLDDFDCDFESVSIYRARDISKEDLANSLLRADTWPLIVATNDYRKSFNKEIRRAMRFRKPLEVGLKIVCTKNNYNYPAVNGETFTIAKVLKDYNTFEKGEILTECGKKLPVTFDEKPPRNLVGIEYGYALTCHKAQGSEWDAVAVVEDKDESPQWRYTAATRSCKKLTYFTNY